jgi:large subunit ribosomal protein L10
MSVTQKKTKERKFKFVSDISSIYANNSAVVMANYHGLTVSQISELKGSLSEVKANFSVIKNKLAKIAAQNFEFNDNISSVLQGPVAVAYSNDMVSVSKVLSEFAKTNQSLKIVGCLLDNKVYDSNKVEQYSSLPTMDESRSKIVGLLKANASKILAVLEEVAKKRSQENV